MNGICLQSNRQEKNHMIHLVGIGYFYPTNQTRPEEFTEDKAGTGMVTAQRLSINLSKKNYQNRLTIMPGDYII
jgi:hypothetical protein